MFFNAFQCQPDLSVNFSKRSAEKNIGRSTLTLILSATLGLSFSNTQAADLSCTWAGGALDSGSWTDLNWNSDAGCSGTFPNNNGTTFDATHPRGIVALDRDITIEAFNLAGGTLTGSGNLTINKIFNWSRGTLAGTGTIRANGGLELNGSLTFKDSQIVVNSTGQQANWNQGNIIMNRGASGFVNEAGATFNAKADDAAMIVLGRTANKFDNDGTLTANLSSVDQNVKINSQMNNRGLVNAQTGELRLGGGGTSSGAFVADENGKINFSGGLHELQGDSIVTGSSVEFSHKGNVGGVNNIGGTYNVGNTELTGGTTNFNADASQTETLTVSGGDLSGSGALLVAGKTTFSSGQMTGTGVTIANGGLELDGNFMAIRDERVLAAGGTLSAWTNGTILLRDEGSVVFNQPGTVFRIAVDRGRMFGKGLVANAGAVVVDLPEGAEPVIIKSNVTNFGQLVLQGDNLAIGGGDDPGPFDTEISLFNGNFIQTETGTTFFDLAGSIAGEEFDVLNIVENAFLDGVFDITLDRDDPANPFLPAAGDIFDILTAKTIVDSGLVLGGVDGALFDFDIVGLDAGNQALRLRVVPLPASVWLFISALLGIWRIGIRKSPVQNMSLVGIRS